MAILSNKAYLMHKHAGEAVFHKLVDITSVPDLIGLPEPLNVTTLSDKRQRNMNGIIQSTELEFTALYTKYDYRRLTMLAAISAEKNPDELDIFQVWFGENGDFGKFEWEGKMVVYAEGFESNSAIPMKLTISDEGYLPLHPANPNAVGSGQVGTMIIA